MVCELIGGYYVVVVEFDDVVVGVDVNDEKIFVGFDVIRKVV